MAILAWVMMGLALWHFMIWLPDRVVGGIVGAFVLAGVGAVISGYAFNGFSVPSEDELKLLISLEAIPGTVIALAIGYAIGASRETD
jgi:hypothetical protein